MSENPLSLAYAPHSLIELQECDLWILKRHKYSTSTLISHVVKLTLRRDLAANDAKLIRVIKW